MRLFVENRVISKLSLTRIVIANNPQFRVNDFGKRRVGCLPIRFLAIYRMVIKGKEVFLNLIKSLGVKKHV